MLNLCWVSGSVRDELFELGRLPEDDEKGDSVGIS